MFDNDVAPRSFSFENQPIPQGSDFELSSLADGGRSLKIWGKFPPNWLGNFTSSLVQEQVSIQGGHVKKLSPLVWGAQLSLSGADAARLDRLDYLLLTRQSQRIDLGLSLRLDAYRLEPSSDVKGAYQLEIRGADQVGFLQSLLKIMALYALYPTEITLATDAGKISDRFLIQGIGGSAPSQQAVDAFKLKLQGMLVH